MSIMKWIFDINNIQVYGTRTCCFNQIIMYWILNKIKLGIEGGFFHEQYELINLNILEKMID
jgi:hypothetical protein